MVFHSCGHEAKPRRWESARGGRHPVTHRDGQDPYIQSGQGLSVLAQMLSSPTFVGLPDRLGGRCTWMGTPRERNFRNLESKLLRELEKFPVRVVRTDYRRVIETTATIASLCRERDVPVNLAVVPGSLDIFVTFLVEISQNPTAAAAVGGLVGSISTYLLSRKLGTVRGKNRLLAFSQVQEALHEDGSYVAQVRTEHVIEGHGYHFILTDNRGRIHDFTIGHRCGLDHEVIR